MDRLLKFEQEPNKVCSSIFSNILLFFLFRKQNIPRFILISHPERSQYQNPKSIRNAPGKDSSTGTVLLPRIIRISHLKRKSIPKEIRTSLIIRKVIHLTLKSQILRLPTNLKETQLLHQAQSQPQNLSPSVVET
jgi:hypothetical protein